MNETVYMRSEEQLNARALELMDPIIRAINMTDDREDIVLLAFMMLNKARDILDQNYGEEKRRFLIGEFS